jgi:hypothetical protein
MTKTEEEQVEEQVIDLKFNKKKTYREIAPLLHKSSRDIRKIIERKEKQIEEEKHRSLCSEALTLFLQDKTPLDVTIALKLRGNEVRELYIEFLALKGMHDFARVYQETKGDIEPLVKLYREIRSWGMDTPQVRTLLEIANIDLPSLRHKQATLLAEAQIIENRVQGLKIEEQNLSINLQRSRSIRLAQWTEIENLHQEKNKSDALVKDFKDNDQGYTKIRKTVQQEVISFLSSSEELLKTALVSLLGSLRDDPDKYAPLIESLYNEISIPGCLPGDVSVDYIDSILVENTNKLHHLLVKDLSAKVINNFLSRRLSGSPELPPPHEQGK